MGRSQQAIVLMRTFRLPSTIVCMQVDTPKSFAGFQTIPLEEVNTPLDLSALALPCSTGNVELLRSEVPDSRALMLTLPSLLEAMTLNRICVLQNELITPTIPRKTRGDLRVNLHHRSKSEPVTPDAFMSIPEDELCTPTERRSADLEEVPLIKRPAVSCT